MKKITAAKLLGALLMFATTSVFATTLYNTAGSFNSQLGGSIVDDYENSGYRFIQSDLEMSGVSGGAKYTATGFENVDLVYDRSGGNHVYCAGCNGTFLLDLTSTAVSGQKGVFGVGFDYDGYYISQSIGAFVTYGDGSTESFLFSGFSNSYLTEFGDNVHYGTGFWGLTSSLEISSVHVGSLDGTGAQWFDRGISIDNLTIGKASSTVPEPSSLVYLVLGLLGIAFVRKRKAA